MPPRRLKASPVDAKTAIELSEVAAGVAGAVLGAKLRLDQDSVAVADHYKASRVLSTLSPPAFAIGEVRVAIKFAIARVERTSSSQRGTKRGPMQVHVHVTAASLAEIAPHLVSEIELRIAPEMRRAQPIEQDSDSPD
jgi:hypothetical protein